MVTGFYFMSLAVKSLPLGTAYAVWTGMGNVGVVIFSLIFFKEPICILLFATGIVGLTVLQGTKLKERRKWKANPSVHQFFSFSE